MEVTPHKSHSISENIRFKSLKNIKKNSTATVFNKTITKRAYDSQEERKNKDSNSFDTKNPSNNPESSLDLSQQIKKVSSRYDECQGCNAQNRNSADF